MNRLCVLLVASMMMFVAGCGGGGDAGDTNSSAAIAPNAPTPAAGRAVALAAATINDAALTATLVKVGETRVSRTVYDYQFKVSLKNGGDVFYSGVGIGVAGNPAGTTIIDGQATVGEAGAGTTVLSADTITIRHDRAFAFDASRLAFSFTGDVAVTARVSPTLAGTLATSGLVKRVASAVGAGPVGGSIDTPLAQGRSSDALFLALNGEGNAIGLAYATHDPVFSARSTAIAMVRIAADIINLGGRSVTSLEQIIADSPLFGQLVEQIDGVYADPAKKRSIEDPVVIQLAWQVAAERQPALQDWWAPPSNQQRSALAVTHAPQWFWESVAGSFGLGEGEGSQVMARNATFAFARVRTVDLMTGNELGSTLAKPISSNVKRLLPEETAIEGSPHFTISIYQDDTSRLANGLGFAGSFVNTFVETMSLLPAGELTKSDEIQKCLSGLVAGFSAEPSLIAFVSTGSVDNLLDFGKDVAKNIGIESIAGCLAKDATAAAMDKLAKALLKEFAGPFKRIWTILKVTDSVLATGSTFYGFIHPHAPVTEEVCQSGIEGTVVACGFSINMLGLPASMKAGESVKVFAQLLDTRGQVVPLTRAATWAIESDAVTIVEQGLELGMAFAVIKAEKAGTAGITASVPSAPATRTTFVRVDPQQREDYRYSMAIRNLACGGNSASMTATITGVSVPGSQTISIDLPTTPACKFGLPGYYSKNLSRLPIALKRGETYQLTLTYNFNLPVFQIVQDGFFEIDLYDEKGVLHPPAVAFIQTGVNAKSGTTTKLFTAWGLP